MSKGVVTILGLFMIMVSVFPATAAEPPSNGDVFTLGEVIVSEEQQAVDLATTVTEITAEDIKARGAQTVADALEMLPGVDIEKGGKGQSYVRVRGFDQGDLKVLIDGIPIYEQYFRDLDLAQLPVAAISKITVTKGASSVLYGANTMGGVINIITKQAGEKPTYEVDTEWGDYGTQSYTVNTGARAGNFSYWLTYNFSQSDAYNLSDDFDPADGFNGTHTVNGKNFQEDGGSRDDSGYIRRMINAKLGWEPTDDTSVFLTFDYHNNAKGIPVRTWTFSDWEQWTLGLVGETRATDWLKLKGRVYYMDFADTIHETATAASGLLGKKYHQFIDSSYDNYTAGSEVQAFINAGQHNYLKFGLNYTLDHHEQKEIPIGSSSWEDTGTFEAQTYSLSAEDEISVNKWLSLVVGASYDYFKPEVKEAPDEDGEIATDHADSINPQIGAVVMLSEKTSLHASIGKKTRFPHLKELYTSSIVNGNPGLDPQQTIAYEIGVEQRFTDRLNGSIAYFYNDISDLIDTTTDSGGNKYYVNINDATIQGLELTLDFAMTRSFSTGLNYTYMNTNDDSTGKELYNRPRHRANLDLRYRFPFGLSTSAQGSYVARQFYEHQTSYARTRATNYFLLSARIEQELGRIWGVEGKIYVAGHNLTDKYYVEDGELTAGRTVTAGLNFRY